MTIELHVVDDLLRHASSNTLWCADENISGFIPKAFAGHILTNRYDIAQQLLQKNPNTTFNDFNFAAIPSSFDDVIFRIAKEKALNLHIIIESLSRLTSQNALHLIGYKNDGINSLRSFIEENFEVSVTVHKHKAQLQHLDIQLLNPPSSLPANSYSQLQQIQDFYSKPGIFGWNKIDKGSAMLMDVMLQHSSDTPAKADKTVLDLGCGYGYLSMRAYQAGYRHIDATDNNAAALLACQKNFVESGIQGEVFADNAGSHCQKRYDRVLCNPPFHQGFDHSKNLIDMFVQQAHRLLKPAGEAWFVVNQFIGIEKCSQNLFSFHELLDKRDGFKVFLLKK